MKFQQHFTGKKGSLSVVKNVAMYDVTLKPSSFLLVSMANLHDQLEPIAQIFEKIYHPFAKFPLAWISIEMI